MDNAVRSFFFIGCSQACNFDIVFRDKYLLYRVSVNRDSLNIGIVFEVKIQPVFVLLKKNKYDGMC